MVNRPRSVTLAACLSAALGFAQTGTITPNSMVDGTRANQVETPKTVLSAESRGDIFMARKMYREAVEAFGEGSPKDPVLRNKIGIAYHQQMQLDTARKYYEQAVKLKPGYSEAGFQLDCLLVVFPGGIELHLLVISDADFIAQHGVLRRTLAKGRRA